MKVSKLGLKTRKTRGNSEDLYTEILFQSMQLKRHAQGIYGYGPILTIARNKLCEHIRQKLNSYDCVEVTLPVLQPKNLWVKSGRWNKYIDSGTMFALEGKNGEYCIAPTGEEIVFDYVNDIVLSYKDLPLTVYQIGNKYRDEIRARGGISRSKEFLMKDAYSFHASQEDMQREYDNLKKCYIEIFEELGLKAFPVSACSADMGGKVSDEFMVVADGGEDTILLDEEHGHAFNEEVAMDNSLSSFYKEQYPYLDFDNMKRVKAIEVGHIFQLNQFYSKSMNGTFTDKDGKEQFYYMGCYGIGVNRTLGACLAQNSDEQGLIFPKKIRPFDVGIVYMDDEQLQEKAFEIYENLKKNGVNVLIDDRKNASLGFKMKDLHLIGVRNVIILGKNYLNSGMIELEIMNEKIEINEKDLINKVKEI